MNLFRSERRVKNWPLYDLVSVESVMPLSDWALVFSRPLMRNRLEPDYLTGVDFMPEWSYVVSVMEEPVGKTTGVMSDE